MPCPHTFLAFRIINIPGGTFAIVDELILTYHNHPTFIVVFRIHSTVHGSRENVQKHVSIFIVSYRIFSLP